MGEKIIAVVGATGAQGGGVARAILADRGGELRVRAITRKPDSEPARRLAAAGAEVVEADLDEPASLKRAFAGAYGAFCMTSYFEHGSPERELAQSRAMAFAAKEAGLSHVVWSTLEDTRAVVPPGHMPVLAGRYYVPHFDAKAEGDAFFAEAGVPTTRLLTAFFWEAFLRFSVGPRKRPDGKVKVLAPLGDAKVPGISVDDIGAAAHGIFKRGAELVGKRVGIASEVLTGHEIAAIFSRVLGADVGYESLSAEELRGRGFPNADALANMFIYHRDFPEACCEGRDIELTRALAPGLASFEAWATRHREELREKIA